MGAGNDGSEDANGQPASNLKANFHWFSSWFALHHGFVSTPLVVATTALPGAAGYSGNALLNAFSVTSAFLFSAPTIGCLGLKRSLVVAMSLYCCFTGLFAVAVFCSDKASALAYALYCLGAVFGGTAAGIGWTAQGAYFSRTVNLVASEVPGAGNRAKVSASLSATFAVWYLGMEVVSKLVWALLDYLGITHWLIAAIFTCMGAGAAIAMSLVRDLEEQPDGLPQENWLTKVRATCSLWGDPVIHLLAGVNVTFGFTAAYMNGYVNQEYTAPQLGTGAVTMLAAMTPASAAVFSYAFGIAAGRFGKGCIVMIGATCFMLIPLLAYLAPFEQWGKGLVFLYLLMGAGRGVYESTNKGVFADFFPRDSVGAFANCMLQSTSALAISFFLGGILTSNTLQTIILILAGLTPLGYLAANWRRSKDAHAEAPLARP